MVEKASVHRLYSGKSRPVPPPATPETLPNVAPQSTTARASSVIDQILMGAARVHGKGVKDQVLAIDRSQDDLRVARQAVEGQIAKLESAQQKLEASMRVTQQRLAELGQRGDDLDGVRTKYEEEIAKDMKTLANLKKELDGLRSQAAKLAQRAGELATAHRTDYQAAKSAEDYMAYLEQLDPAEVPDGAMEHAKKEAASNAAAQALSKLHKGEEAIRSNRQAQAENSRAQGEVSIDVAGTESVIAEEQAALRVTMAELDEVKSKTKELRTRAREQGEQLAENEHDLKSASGRVASLTGQIDQLEARRRQLIDSAIAADKADIRAILTQLESLERDTASLKDQLLGAKNDLNDAQARREILDAARVALDGDMRDLEVRLVHLVADETLAKGDKDAAMRDVASTRRAIGSIDEQDADLLRQGNKVSDERFALLREQSALDELAKLPPEKLAPADRERLARRQDLNGQIEALGSKISEINGRRSQLAEDLSEKNEDVKQAQERIKRAQQRLGDLGREINLGRAAQGKTAREIQETQAELQAASKAVEQAIADQRAIEGAMNRLGKAQEALQTHKTKLEADIQELESLQR